LRSIVAASPLRLARAHLAPYFSPILLDMPAEPLCALRRQTVVVLFVDRRAHPLAKRMPPERLLVGQYRKKVAHRGERLLAVMGEAQKQFLVADLM
jgi:hypothetical protein